jgi:hypothetical protein
MLIIIKVMTFRISAIIMRRDWLEQHHLQDLQNRLHHQPDTASMAMKL